MYEFSPKIDAKRLNPEIICPNSAPFRIDVYWSITDRQSPNRNRSIIPIGGIDFMGQEFNREKKLSEYKEARIELTELNNLPLSTYLLLACDKNADVRYSLASNANIPIFILKRLSEDENVYVSCRAKKSIQRLEAASVSELESFAKVSPVVYDLGRR